MNQRTRWAKAPLLVCTIGLWSCGSGADEAVSVPEARAGLGSSSARVSPKNDKKSSPVVAELPTLAAARGPFLSQVPKDSLLVLRLPSPRRAREAFLQSSLWQAFTKLESLYRQLADLWDQGLGTLDSSLPAPLSELLAELAGDVVFAIPAFDPTALLRGEFDGLPCSLLLHAELDGNPRHLITFMERAEREYGGVPRFDTEMPEGSRRLVFERGSVRVDVLLDPRTLTVCVSPPSMTKTPMDMRRLAMEESFLAANVTRATPAPDASTGVGELWLNLAPVWPLLRTAAPAEVRTALDSCGADHVDGLSLVTNLSDGLFHERFQLHSTGGGDLFSKLFGGSVVDPAYLRWLPGDVENAGLLAFDLENALKIVQNALPSEHRRSFAQALSSLDTMTGLALRQDVLNNLGPQFAVWNNGTVLGSEGMSPNFAVGLAIQVERPDAFRSVLGQIVSMTGMGGMQRAHECVGQKFHSLPLPPIPGGPPALSTFVEPSYCVVDSTFVFASHPDAMSKTLTAARAEGEQAPARLRELCASSDHGLVSVNFTDSGAQVRTILGSARQALQQAPQLPVAFSLPSDAEWNAFADVLADGHGSAYTGPYGLVLENHSPISLLLGSVVVGGGAITASVLVPNLMKARAEAQEQSVRSVLRRIASVQSTIKSGAYIDTDADGVGEYAFFGEMTGAVPIRGGAARIGKSPLPEEFSQLRQGVVHYAGHLFRMDLPDRAGTPCPEMADGGAPKSTDSDGAESGFVVYCWPEQVGVTGQRVFVLDETGDVYASANDRPDQVYSGLERSPVGDAAFLEADDNRVRGTRSVRRGRDGGLWLKEDF